jgi:hypothetical protein
MLHYDILELSLTIVGQGRNGFSADQVEFPPVPEHLQEGPFYATSIPLQIWRITMHQAVENPFVF